MTAANPDRDSAGDRGQPPGPGAVQDRAEVAVSADDPRLAGMAAMLGVMDRLRGEGGCPWDREQTSASLRPYLLEETYEVLEVLDAGDLSSLQEELGDLLFQIVFHSRIHQESGAFDFGDVAAGIADKLLSRHPHVFGDAEQRKERDAWRRWEEMKQKERGPKASRLDGIPSAMPALARSRKLQDKAAKVGFDWGDAAGPLDKMKEELDELQAEVEAGDKERAREEFGDLAFALVALSRHLDVDAEIALREANTKFERRFRAMEELSKRPLAEHDSDGLEALWEQVKRDAAGG